MADMHTPLKPCPHCGGEAEFSQTGWNELTLRCVGVQPSGLRGCGPMYRQRVLPNRHTLDWLQGMMAETWNRRAPSQDAETIKALREALERTTLLLNAAGKAIEEHGFNMDFTDVDGIETDHIGFSIDCENAVERGRAALAGSAS